MKVRKILAVILTVAMILSTMSFTVMAESSYVDPVMEDVTYYAEDDVIELASSTYAMIGETTYPTVEEAIKAAKDGDTVVLSEGRFSQINFNGKNINLEGTLGDKGELLTEVYGGNPALVMHGVNGTVKNIKITNAFKVVYAEPAGNLVFDNIYITGATYGLHLIAYESGLTWTLKNSYMDISWANSLSAHQCDHATINIINNELKSTSPYYPGYGAPIVNSYSPNTTVSENVFGENAKIYFRTEEAAAGAVIGNNFYADGVDNAFIVDSDSYEAPISSYYETPEKEVVVGNAPFKLGDSYYFEFNEVLDLANENDVITLMPGEYDFDNKIVINKSVTITGDPNYGSATLTASAGSLTKPVINITDVTNGGVEYHAPNVVFDNLVFNVEEDAVGNGWNVSAIGYYYEILADREGLTVTNCDFINNSPISMSAIAANIANYTVTGNTFKNFTTMVHSFVDHGPLGTVVVADNTYANVDNIVNVYWGVDDGNTASISVTDNKSTDGEIAKIAIDNFGMTKATPVVAIDSAVITGNDAEVVYQNYTKATALNTDDEVVYTYKNEGTAAIGAASGVTGYVYTNYGSADEKALYLNNGVVAGTPEIIRVLFDNITPVDDKGNYTVEGERTYNINLKVSDAEIINRLNSADLTFEINTTKGDIAYEIIASNDEVEINPVYNPADGSVIEGRYEFHYAGKDNVKTDTDTLITIGKVKFTGYGEFTFAVDKDSMTNAAHTTTLQDNIVETYFPAGDITKGEGKLDIDGAKFNENIAIAKRNLVINVAFPNAIEANSKDYQDMTITVTGPEGYKTVIDLADGNDGENLQTAANGDVYYSTDDANTAAVEGLDLTLNTPYTVTVEGAGYRTVKYTVNMTEDKTLNFWNNVKDNAKAVEVSESGIEKYAQKVTFLAGDIVKDNDINVYDLSAVVSYFGEIDLDENNKPEYA